MASQDRRDGGIYQLLVALELIEPPIWRRVQVPGETTLGELHDVLQVAMGWHNCHLHLFEIDGATYGPLGDGAPWLEDMSDERKTRLDRVVGREGATFAYVYDMGDDWEHRIVLEADLPRGPDTRYPVCTEGERGCPPEDCGGPFQYPEFLDAISDPDHPEHDEMTDWIGDSFDPEAFDIDFVNRQLRKVK